MAPALLGYPPASRHLNGLLHALLAPGTVLYLSQGYTSPEYTAGAEPIALDPAVGYYREVPDYSRSQDGMERLKAAFPETDGFRWRTTHYEARPARPWTALLDVLDDQGGILKQYRADEQSEARAVAMAAYKFFADSPR